MNSVKDSCIRGQFDAGTPADSMESCTLGFVQFLELLLRIGLTPTMIAYFRHGTKFIVVNKDDY